MRAGAIIVVAVCGVLSTAGLARADERMVSRSLLLPGKTFGFDASVRGSDGYEGEMFEYSVFRLVAGTGSGRTDIKLGLDLVMSSPDDAGDVDTLDRVDVELSTGAGKSGSINLDMTSYRPADRDVFAGSVDLGVLFKRGAGDRVAILGGFGFDFFYIKVTDDAIPVEQDPWATRFYLDGGGIVQISDTFAGELTGRLLVPVAEGGDEGWLVHSTTYNVRVRGYAALHADFDAYLELGFYGGHDLSRNLTIQDEAQAVFGFLGRL